MYIENRCFKCGRFVKKSRSHKDYYECPLCFTKKCHDNMMNNRDKYLKLLAHLTEEEAIRKMLKYENS